MSRAAHNRITHIRNEDVVAKYRKGMSSIQIAQEYGVDKSIILRRLKEVGEPTRKPCTYPEITPELLREMYVEQKLSTRAIAQIIGCSNNLVCKRLKQFDIGARMNAGDSAFTPEERKEKWGKRLEEHPRWKGGVTAVSGLIRNRLAPVSRERLSLDGYTCQVCGTPNGNMHVHHKRHFSDIISDILKENTKINLLNETDRLIFVDICEKDERLLDLDNLVTLCESCHENEHSDEYIEPVMWEVLEERWRDYVRKNHLNMSIKEMREVVRAQNIRIVEFMETENLKFAYDNPKWLEEQMKVKHFTDISREFTCKTRKITSDFIKEKAKNFGLIDEGTAEIVDLYYKNHSIQDISDMTGFSKPTIRKRLLKKGIDTRDKAYRKDVKFDDIVGMVNEGHSLQSIAESKKCSVFKIRSVLASEGTSITELKRASSI